MSRRNGNSGLEDKLRRADRKREALSQKGRSTRGHCDSACGVRRDQSQINMAQLSSRVARRGPPDRAGPIPGRGCPFSFARASYQANGSSQAGHTTQSPKKSLRTWSLIRLQCGHLSNIAGFPPEQAGAPLPWVRARLVPGGAPGDWRLLACCSATRYRRGDWGRGAGGPPGDVTIR